MSKDVTICGAGPAGMALALECAARGLSVALVDPGAHTPWPATYGMFGDQVDTLGLSRFVRARFTRPFLELGAGRVDLGRAYALLDNTALWRDWDERLCEQGVKRVCAAAHGVNQAGDTVVTHLDGTNLRSRVVIDATGAACRLLGRDAGRAAQVAVGWVVRLRHVPWSSDEACWMDFRELEAGPATFLYALPLGGDRVLIEETSLASDPPLTPALLEHRLRLRIAKLGLDVLQVEQKEFVRIPLMGEIPEPRGALAAFGAAAGFVHPATGYAIGRSLESAPGFADALATGLQRDGVTAARMAHAAVWPRSARWVRHLHGVGLRTVLRMDANRTRRFFEQFFKLSAARQAAFLGTNSRPQDVADAMWALFRQGGSSVRSDVAHGLFGRPRQHHLANPIGGTP